MAIAILVFLPAAINLPFAFAGQPLMGGDNLSQNYPLRVLAGELIRHGRLPLWNPDIWSGAPLLAGWNAGAMYPGTWLFAVLPPVAAWELNVISVGVVGGIGLHVFLRRQGCSAVASLLGALTFSYTGFMSGQSVHLGLIISMAFAPWMLIGLDEMSVSVTARQLARPIALLGAAGGLSVLAGDPRGFSDDAIVAAIYLVALCWRRRSKAAICRLLAGVASSAVVAAALSAVQWLPGLAFLHQSQRAAAKLAFFGSYSLHTGQLAYLFEPFLFGGNGSLGLPTTNFNLPEYTYSAGLVPLVALFVLAGRALLRRHSTDADPPVVVYIVMVVVGTLLSLGTTTPLGRLLVHLPLYGGERLQNRNMGIVDLALAVLAAFFLDLLLPAKSEDRHQPSHLGRPERILGLLPSVVVIALIVAMLVATAGTERFLGATSLALGLPVRMAPYYAFAAAVAVSAAVLVGRVRWRRPHSRRRLATFLVGADVAMFIAMASYQLAPPGALALHNPYLTTLTQAAGGATGRDAIFNPQQLAVTEPADAIDDLGLNDLVVLHDQLSVQGYGSAVSGAYESATGTHEVENLRPSQLLGPLFDILDLRVLVTLPELFGTIRPSANDLSLPAGAPRAAGTSLADRQPGNAVVFGPLPPAGPWRLAGTSTTFELPGPLAIDQAAVRVGGDGGSSPVGTRLRLVVVLASGARYSTAARAAGALVVMKLPAGTITAGGGALDLEVSGSSAGGAVLRAVAVHVIGSKQNVPLRSDQSSPGPAWFELDGLLQGLLPPSAWRYEDHAGPLVMYRNTRANGQAWLQPASSHSVTPDRSAGTVVQPRVDAWQDPVDIVDSARPALLVRSEAYAPGWSVTIAPDAPGGGARESGAAPGSTKLAVRAVGLVQGVELPAGRYVVTWHYSSGRAVVGLGAGAVATMGLVVLVIISRRRPRADRMQP